VAWGETGAGSEGVAITTRVATTPDDDQVLDVIAAHVGRLRRADLARVVRPVGVDPSLDGDAKRQVRRDRLNARKTRADRVIECAVANAVIAANDDQYRLARTPSTPYRGLRAAIATIEQRLGAPPSTC